jgi:choline dehydrogenase-like flavoprotein
MKNKHVNAIVVGAGAGGGIVAKELAIAGLSVVLFERGGWATYDDHDDDELISQRTTVLGNAFGPDDTTASQGSCKQRWFATNCSAKRGRIQQ